jgi:phosphonate transport system substrate-binding protein
MHLLRHWILSVALLTLTACGSGSISTPTADSPTIRLSQLEPLPIRPDQSVVPLRVAVAAVISPQGTVESYQRLLDYLSVRLHRPVQLVQRRTYAEVNTLLETGAVDLAFVCTSAYVDGHDRFGMELLAAPRVNGETVYHSVLIVPAESSAQGIGDLRGKVFAFTDPMSMSGRVYPLSLVRELGAEPETFFARTFFTYGHDDAIRAVADHLADGAMVDSLVYEFAIERDPSIARSTRMVVKSPPFGIPPVVTGPHTRPQLRADLQQALLDLSSDQSPEARQALQAIGVERFVLIEDSAYQSARVLLTSTGAALREIAP